MHGAILRLGAVIVLSVGGITCAHAQAGPPLLTNDAGTPGPNRWEINLAGVRSTSGAETVQSLPDLDINYGVGEHIQVSVHLPWTQSQAMKGQGALGATEYAVRWRFLDQARAGVDMAVQPHMVLPGAPRAVREAVSQVHREYVLPVQMVRQWDSLATGIEIARHWVEHARGAIQAGAFAARRCGVVECLAEINTTHDYGGDTQTMVGFGLRHQVSGHVKLMAAYDRQINGPATGRASVIYLGVQLMR